MNVKRSPSSRTSCLVRSVCVLLLTSALGQQVDAADDKAVEHAPEFRLGESPLSLPLKEVKGYPFVDVTIDGRTGEFMVDTGSQKTLALNTRRFDIKDLPVTGRGFFGSGQHFDLFSVPVVHDVRIGSRTFAQVHAVSAQDARQLEAITPDFGGWVGYGFWQRGALKLSYSHKRVGFYPQGDVQSALKGEKILCAVHYGTRKLPNQPIVPIRLGTIDSVAAFDTGQYGSLYAKADTVAELVKQGVITQDGEGTYALHSLNLGCGRKVSIAHVALEEPPFPAAGPIGLPEPTILTIGYGLLKQYDSVWDFDTKTIYLLQNP